MLCEKEWKGKAHQVNSHKATSGDTRVLILQLTVMISKI